MVVVYTTDWYPLNRFFSIDTAFNKQEDVPDGIEIIDEYVIDGKLVFKKVNKMIADKFVNSLNEKIQDLFNNYNLGSCGISDMNLNGDFIILTLVVSRCFIDPRKSLLSKDVEEFTTNSDFLSLLGTDKITIQENFFSKTGLGDQKATLKFSYKVKPDNVSKGVDNKMNINKKVFFNDGVQQKTLSIEHFSDKPNKVYLSLSTTRLRELANLVAVSVELGLDDLSKLITELIAMKATLSKQYLDKQLKNIVNVECPNLDTLTEASFEDQWDELMKMQPTLHDFIGWLKFRNYRLCPDKNILKMSFKKDDIEVMIDRELEKIIVSNHKLYFSTIHQIDYKDAQPMKQFVIDSEKDLKGSVRNVFPWCW